MSRLKSTQSPCHQMRKVSIIYKPDKLFIAATKSTKVPPNGRNNIEFDSQHIDISPNDKPQKKPIHATMQFLRILNVLLLQSTCRMLRAQNLTSGFS